MLKKIYEILMPFVKKPWKKYTFKEIKKLTQKKSESYLFNSLKKFVKQGVLKEEKVGNSVIYSVDLTYFPAQFCLGFVAAYLSWQKYPSLVKQAGEIISRLPLHFYTLIVTGSYANNTYKKDSDIDLVIITEDEINSKKIYAELMHFCEMNIPKIHLHVFKKSEFLEMLTNKEANYGKEIAGNNLLLCGAENYYKLISEALQNGFTG